MAEGVTEIENLHHIDRGYENFESKLKSIGADVIRYNDSVELVNDVMVNEVKS